MKHSKRVMAVVASLAISALALSGCGTSASKEATDEDITITLWTWGAGLEEQAAMYKKEHPNITVEFVNAGVGIVEYEKVRNAMKAGTGAPDAFFTAAAVAPSFVASDSIVDLNEYGAADLKDDHIPWAWEAGEIDGGHYFYPVGWGPLMYFYRADVFEKHDIEVPETWEEFAAASEKLHKADPDMYLSNFPSLDVSWAGMLWQAGQQPFTSEGTNLEINWDGEATQEVATYWQDLLDKDLVARVQDFTPDWNQAVAQDKFASFVGGTWYTPLISAAASDQSGKWRAALLPQWNAGENESAEAGLAGFAITKQSKHPVETEAFIRWLTASEESVTKLHEQGNFPTFEPVLNSSAVQDKADPFFGDQKLAPIFLESGEGISTDYQFGPFYDVVQSQQYEAIGQSLQNQTTLPKGMTKMQESLTAHAKDQGYTVK